MPTRRTIFTSAAVLGLGALIFSGKTDDLIRAAGIDPVPEVRAADQEFVTNAISDNQKLLSAATALNTEVAHKILVQQIIDLGGSAREIPIDDPPKTLAQFQSRLRETSERRRNDAYEATSTQLAQTLASCAAGLAQVGHLDHEEL